jgi:hypothetical protein
MSSVSSIASNSFRQCPAASMHAFENFSNDKTWDVDGGLSLLPSFVLARCNKLGRVASMMDYRNFSFKRIMTARNTLYLV